MTADVLNPYTRIIVEEALRRGIEVEVLDPAVGELRLRCGDRTISTIQSLSELTSAVAFRRCDHKATTRRILEAAGIPVAPGRLATFDQADRDFLALHGDVVVKPARGEGGQGITVGVTDEGALHTALAAARSVSDDVLLERRMDGDDVRVLVIGGAVVAAAVRRPPRVVGDGRSTVGELVTDLARRRSAATGGAARIPLDGATEEVVRAAGWSIDDVLPAGETVAVRRTANVHTGGTIEDVTDELHPELAAVALRVAEVLEIPVVGVDLLVPAVDGPDHVVVEANEQPGLANHEPRPTAERFLDLLFPETATQAS